MTFLLIWKLRQKMKLMQSPVTLSHLPFVAWQLYMKRTKRIEFSLYERCFQNDIFSGWHSFNYGIFALKYFLNVSFDRSYFRPLNDTQKSNLFHDESWLTPQWKQYFRRSIFSNDVSTVRGGRYLTKQRSQWCVYNMVQEVIALLWLYQMALNLGSYQFNRNV